MRVIQDNGTANDGISRAFNASNGTYTDFKNPSGTLTVLDTNATGGSNYEFQGLDSKNRPASRQPRRRRKRRHPDDQRPWHGQQRGRGPQELDGDRRRPGDRHPGLGTGQRVPQHEHGQPDDRAGGRQPPHPPGQRHPQRRHLPRLQRQQRHLHRLQEPDRHPHRQGHQRDRGQHLRVPDPRRPRPPRPTSTWIRGATPTRSSSPALTPTSSRTSSTQRSSSTAWSSASRVPGLRTCCSTRTW